MLRPPISRATAARLPATPGSIPARQLLTPGLLRPRRCLVLIARLLLALLGLRRVHGVPAIAVVGKLIAGRWDLYLEATAYPNWTSPPTLDYRFQLNVGYIFPSPREPGWRACRIRQAWDSGGLSTLTRNEPLRATGAHISIIGHITEEELRRQLRETDRVNGFANRFLWVLVRRSKVLPEGAAVPDAVLAPLVSELREVVAFAGTVGEMARDEDAREAWADVYPDLSEGRPGMLGAITSRAEAQVLRLSALYAVLDRSRSIRRAHLRAGLAVWQYAEASARRIFGELLGSPVADAILEALRRRGPLAESELHALFARNRTRAAIHGALAELLAAGQVRSRTERTGGRPAIVWGVR